MSFFYSLIAAIVPMFLYLILIWRLDRYEREPFGKVIGHFLWGAFGAVFFGILISTIFNATAGFIMNNPTSVSFVGTVIVAPVVEECVKAIYLIRTYKKNYFDNLTDGLVYGGAIGLGFGMTENLLYFTVYDHTFEHWLSIVIIRSIFSAVMHAIATAAVGTFLAKAKFGLSKNKSLLITSGLCIAMLIHAIWNFSMTFEFTYYAGIIFMLLLITGFFVVYSNSLKREQKIIEVQLKDEEVSGLIHFNNKRRKFLLNEGMIDNLNNKQVRKILYFATKLAFSKFQAENSRGLQKEYYSSMVIEIRSLISKLISS